MGGLAEGGAHVLAVFDATRHALRLLVGIRHALSGIGAKHSDDLLDWSKYIFRPMGRTGLFFCSSLILSFKQYLF